MAILVQNITTGLENAEQRAFEKALCLLGIPQSRVKDIYISKSSVDARRRGNIRLVFTVGVELLCDEAAVVQKCGGSLQLDAPAQLEIPRVANPPKLPPVVVGLGPAGLFAGLVLARAGLAPLIIERGSPVEERSRQVESFWRTGSLLPHSNVQFGEGGAGTFSDGKLTTRINDPLCSFVKQQLEQFGAPHEAMRKAKPHIGTDYLRQIVQALRQEILRLGGQVRFATHLEDIELQNGKLTGVCLNGEWQPAETLLLATGHSARDTFAMLLGRGLVAQPKPFSVGVRIEHLQHEVNKALYGPLEGHPALPQGEYQLSHREGERAVYTFCMCPGGVVVPAASQQGELVVNGMSYHDRAGQNANAALVVSVAPETFGGHMLAGVEFQRRLEQAAFAVGGSSWAAPAQSVGHFLAGKIGWQGEGVAPSYALGVTPARLDTLFPTEIAAMLRLGLQRFGARQPGFDHPQAMLTGVETRTSSPLRFVRGEDMQALGLSGIYPCGEGAGYAGGIMSAAVDGIRAALALSGRYCVQV